MPPELGINSSSVREANRLFIPTIALLDTNCDPEGIDYPIPGNDDAIRSIKFVTSMLAEAVLEGRQKHLQIKKPKKAKQAEKKEEQAKEEPVEAQEPVEAEEEVLAEEVEKKLKQPEEPHLRKKPRSEGKRKPKS